MISVKNHISIQKIMKIFNTKLIAISFAFSLCATIGMAQGPPPSSSQCSSNYNVCASLAQLEHDEGMELCELLSPSRWKDLCSSYTLSTYYQTLDGCGNTLVACLGGNQ